MTSAGGEIAGVPLTGQIAASAGLGLLLPLSDEASVVLEASYDGARFEGLDADARLLAGLNWQIHPTGKLRAALATGLADVSPDVQLVAGYAFVF